jgi:translation elongation factor EF-Ts
MGEMKMATQKGQDVKQLSLETGMGMHNCAKAYEYANGDHDLAVAYLKAKTLAVATPGLNFDERVQFFLRKEHVNG